MGLREVFSAVVSSCFVGLRKPEPAIYQLALEVTQKEPGECCFIDDRALNLEAARRLLMHTIEMRDVEQLRRELRKLEVEIRSGSNKSPPSYSAQDDSSGFSRNL